VRKAMRRKEVQDGESVRREERFDHIPQAFCEKQVRCDRFHRFLRIAINSSLFDRNRAVLTVENLNPGPRPGGFARWKGDGSAAFAGQFFASTSSPDRPSFPGTRPPSMPLVLMDLHLPTIGPRSVRRVQLDLLCPVLDFRRPSPVAIDLPLSLLCSTLGVVHHSRQEHLPHFANAHSRPNVEPGDVREMDPAPFSCP
jgi:hypothetical protein